MMFKPEAITYRSTLVNIKNTKTLKQIRIVEFHGITMKIAFEK